MSTGTVATSHSRGVPVPSPLFVWDPGIATLNGNPDTRIVSMTDTVSGLTLTAIGSAFPQQQAWAGGGVKYGVAHFDGTNSLEVTNLTSAIPFRGVNQFTVRARIRVRSPSGSVTAFRVYDLGDTNGFTFGVASASGNITHSRADEAGTFTVTTWAGAVPAADTSVTLTQVYSSASGGLKLYSDGALVSAQTNTRNIGTDIDRFVMSFGSSSPGHQVGEVRVWNSGLTAAEVLADHNSVAADWP